MHANIKDISYNFENFSRKINSWNLYTYLLTKVKLHDWRSSLRQLLWTTSSIFVITIEGGKMQVQQVRCGCKGQRLQGSSKVGGKFDGCRGNGWSNFRRVGRLPFVFPALQVWGVWRAQLFLGSGRPFSGSGGIWFDGRQEILDCKEQVHIFHLECIICNS